MRNLDEFAAALNQVTTEAIQAAGSTAKTRALVNAAKSGDEAKVRRLAAGMSTADLKRVKKQLEA